VPTLHHSPALFVDRSAARAPEAVSPPARMRRSESHDSVSTASTGGDERYVDAESHVADASAPTIDGFVRDATHAVLHQLLPGTVARSASGLADKILGQDVTQVCRAPDPAQRWTSRPFASVAPELRATLAGRLPEAAPYFSHGATASTGEIRRTTLAPAELCFDGDHLSGVLRTAAKGLARLELANVRKTRAYAYTAVAGAPSFAETRAAVAQHRTEPKGAMLKALRPLLDRDRAAFVARDLDVEVVRVPNVRSHPTYVAATLGPRDGVTPQRGATSVVLFKRGHTASSAELVHLDAFAARLLAPDGANPPS